MQSDIRGVLVDGRPHMPSKGCEPLEYYARGNKGAGQDV